MLVDALTNAYLGSLKSKDGDKFEPIPQIFFKILFLSRSGVTTRWKRRDIGKKKLQLSNS